MTLRQIQNGISDFTILTLLCSVFALIGYSIFKRRSLRERELTTKLEEIEQSRRLSELRISQKQHTYRQDDIMDPVRSGQSQSRQSRQELLAQLEDMKELQQDAKLMISELKLMTERYSSNKPNIRSTSSSDKSKYQKSD